MQNKSQQSLLYLLLLTVSHALRAGLFVAGSGRARRLRELVVDLAAPVMGGAVPDQARSPAGAQGGEEAPQDGLNAEQREAVGRCCLALVTLMKW